MKSYKVFMNDASSIPGIHHTKPLRHYGSENNLDKLNTSSLYARRASSAEISHPIRKRAEENIKRKLEEEKVQSFLADSEKFVSEYMKAIINSVNFIETELKNNNKKYSQKNNKELSSDIVGVVDFIKQEYEKLIAEKFMYSNLIDKKIDIEKVDFKNINELSNENDNELSEKSRVKLIKSRITHLDEMLLKILEKIKEMEEEAAENLSERPSVNSHMFLLDALFSLSVIVAAFFANFSFLFAGFGAAFSYIIQGSICIARLIFSYNLYKFEKEKKEIDLLISELKKIKKYFHDVDEKNFSENKALSKESIKSKLDKILNEIDKEKKSYRTQRYESDRERLGATLEALMKSVENLQKLNEAYSARSSPSPPPFICTHSGMSSPDLGPGPLSINIPRSSSFSGPSSSYPNLEVGDPSYFSGRRHRQSSWDAPITPMSIFSRPGHRLYQPPSPLAERSFSAPLERN